ncbi:MAG: hypothetical protein ACKOF9_06775 [Burkholderiales bacterium]
MKDVNSNLFSQGNARSDSAKAVGMMAHKAAMTVMAVIALTGCVTTQPQPDGSTKVHLSLGAPAKVSPDSTQPVLTPATEVRPAGATNQAKQDRTSPVSAPGIRTTALAGVFSKHPYDGTPKTYFPRVAVTVTEWSRNDCWIGSATIWWSKSKSEAVPAFSVCWGQSVGYAVNNAANLHLFMQQMAVEHSGNVRTTGPKPPMLAIPDRQPISERQQLAFQGFVQQLVLDTGWQPGAPTNLWLVGYDANVVIKPTVLPVSSYGASQPMNTKAKAQLEQALTCSAIGPRFDLAESKLKQAGWNPDQGITPVTLAEPVKVYGFVVRKVAVSRDGGEQTYRSYLARVTVQQLVKSAALKLGKDGKTYGRLTKVGELSVGMEGGETTLTCTVNTEGSEG